MLAPASPLGPARTGEPWFRRVVLYSLLAAPCPLVPVPLLDDWVESRVRKRMVVDLARGRVPLSEREVAILAGLEAPASGCFVLALLVTGFRLVFKLLGGLFRKVLFFLTIKDCVTATSRTFHEGYLLHRALDGPSAGLDAHRVRRAVEAAIREVDPRPVRGVIRGVLATGKAALVGTARLFGNTFRRRADRVAGEAALPVDEGEALVGGLVDQLAAALGQDRDHLARLDGALFRALQAARLDPPERNRETSGR